MKRPVATVVATFMLSILAAPVFFAADAHRYIAVFSDGNILEGNQLHLWHEPGSIPTLEGVSLISAANQARWIRDRRLREKAHKDTPASFVEFVGGDRLPGKVVGASIETPGAMPSSLLVDTGDVFARPGRETRKFLRVLPSKVQRIAWRRSERQELTPGFAYLRSGQAVEFRRLRWGKGTISLLLRDGVREFAFGELAELHPMLGDPWETCYDDLAVLSPGLESLLFRIETIEGLIATSSRSRFQAIPFSSAQQREQFGRVMASLQGQLNNFERNRKVRLDRIDALQKKLDAELKKQAATVEADSREANKVLEGTAQFLTRMEERHRRRLDTQDRLTANLEKSRARQLAKLPEEKRKAELEAFRKDRQRQRAQIERQNAEEDLRTRRQRQAQDQGRLDRMKVLQKNQLERLRRSNTGGQLIAQVNEYNNWLEGMERVKERLRMLRQERGDPDTWQHMVQPAWSLDPIWTPFNRIHTCSFFTPREVPLSRLYPAGFKERHYLAKTSGWRLNRNSRNAFLASAGREHGWGFAVHAYSELHFDLADLVTGFRSRLGLDRQVGDGGCAAGRVFLGSIDSQPLYQSPFLVGSHRAVDTGRLALPAAAGGRRRLILQADTAHDEGISAVDPFDIRDMVDWLEPMLELDRERLAGVVSKRIHLNVSAWRGWNPALGTKARCEWKFVLENRVEDYFFPALSLRDAPLVLSRQVQPSEERKWLQVDMGPVNSLRPDPSILAVRVGGKELVPASLPRRQTWQVGPIPLLYDLGINKEAPITVEITQRPGGEFTCWRDLSITHGPSAVYELSTLLAEAGGENIQLTRAVARILKSGALGFEEKKTALELYRKGAELNYGIKLLTAQPRVLGGRDLWKATASHFAPAGDTPRNAIDGDPDTRWTSNFSQHPGMWFSLELPGPTLLGGVRLLTPGSNDHPMGYELYTSMDGVNWSGTLAKGVGSTPVTEAVFQSVKGRFLRIVQTGAKSLWWSINELQVLEPEIVDVVTSVLVGESWSGGAEDIALLKELPTLKTVYFSGAKSVGPEARLELRRDLETVTFKEHERIPSVTGPQCEFKVTNGTKKNVKIFWIGLNSEDVPRPELAPGKSWVCRSYVGHRWEARTDGHRVGFFVVEPGFNWLVNGGE